jgi:hypothetical protein
MNENPTTTQKNEDEEVFEFFPEVEYPSQEEEELKKVIKERRKTLAVRDENVPVATGNRVHGKALSAKTETKEISCADDITVKIVGDKLVLSMPLKFPLKPSTTGKSFVVAGTGGVIKVSQIEIKGMPLKINASAYIKNMKRPRPI